jgi:hypothetical protein
MQFDYLVSNVSRSYTEGLKKRFDASFAEEVQARAQLLCNLGWTLEDARKQIKAAVAWEFDGTWNRPVPRLAKAVDEQTLVIYQRLGYQAPKAAAKASAPKAPAAKKPAAKKPAKKK